jgi:putative heme-binding domain-containing protein
MPATGDATGAEQIFTSKRIARRIVGVMLLPLFAMLLAQHGSSTTVNPFTKAEDVHNGAAIYRGRCSGCHGLDGVGAGAGPALNSGRYRHGGSDEALFQTIGKGVPGTTMPAFSNLTAQQTWQTIAYLRTLSAASRGSASLKGDANAGAAIYKAKCAGCHDNAAPDLVGIGMRQSSATLRESIVNPNAEVASDHWRVRIQTAQGAQIEGTRLNEDTYSIQLRVQGRLRSVLRSEITKLEWIRTSPMPAPQLAAQELDNLLAYIVSMKEGN